MKTISALFFLAFAGVAMGYDLVGGGGRVYHNFKVTEKTVMGVHFTYDNGVGYMHFRMMTEADQKKYGYDPVKEREYLEEKQRERDVQEEQRRVEVRKIIKEKRAAELKRRQEAQLAARAAKKERRQLILVAAVFLGTLGLAMVFWRRPASPEPAK